MQREPSPSDVTDAEWAFVAPSLALMTTDAPQRRHDLRVVPGGVRSIMTPGGPWRSMPHDLPPWAAVYQQARCWLAAGSFHAIL
jgi:transposase